MSKESEDLWDRALESLEAAETVCQVSPDAAASRAYYAAFFGVSALFAIEGKTFKKHSGIEAAVHRDLVRTGRWPKRRGANYSQLFELRQTGDYGVSEHVTEKDAHQALETTKNILKAISAEKPRDFSWPENGN